MDQAASSQHAPPPAATPHGVTILVTPRGCLDPANGGGQRTQLFLEALCRLGPVVIAVDGRPPNERLRAMVPAAADVVALGAPPKGFPGKERIRRLRRRHKLYRYLQDYELNPRARQALRDLVREHQADAIVFRYFTTYHNCVGPDDVDLQRISLVDLDDRDDVMAERSWATAFGAAGRLVYAMLIRRIIHGKMRALGQANAYFTVSNGDEMPDLGPPAIYVPNTVLHEPDPASLTRPSAQRDLLFVGGFGHYPNPPAVRWFLRHCWPPIRRAHPDAAFRIVGNGPWKKMAAEFPGIEGVDFRGFVEELAPEYLGCRLVVAPLLQGGGTSIKVVEAAAFARPVVAMPAAARGLAPGFVAALSVASDPAGFTRDCLALLADDALADSRGAAARAAQGALYSRQPILATIVAAVLDAKARGAAKRQPPQDAGTPSAKDHRGLQGRRRQRGARLGPVRRCCQSVIRAMRPAIRLDGNHGPDGRGRIEGSGLAP